MTARLNKIHRFPCIFTWIVGAAAYLTVAASPPSANGQQSAAKQQQLKCETGPIERTYGSTKWLVYSCNDNRSVVIVSAPGNPAMPFYFFFSPSENGYQLTGEGTGRKETTAAVVEELKILSVKDIGNLIADTKRR